MTINSKIKSIIVLAVLVAFIAPKYTQADEYKWLVSSNYDEIFILANTKSCAIAEDQLTKSLEGVFLRSRMQPFISKKNAPIIIVTNEGKFDHFLIHKLVENKKPFFYIFARCEKYESGYIYGMEIRFGIVDDEHMLLHSVPDYGVMGIGDVDRINTVFKAQVEDAVADYLSSNIQKIK